MHFYTERLQPIASILARVIDRAAALDRIADIELQHGHAVAAERLASLAAELRTGTAQ